MEPSANGTAMIPEPNLFGSPTRVILLGYYDGPTEGVIQFESGDVFHFAMPDEEMQLSRRSHTREYSFHSLPMNALVRLETVLAEHLMPSRPVWYVTWRFESPEVEAATDLRVKAILAEAASPGWSVTLPEIWSMQNFHPTRVVALQAA